MVSFEALFQDLKTNFQSYPLLLKMWGKIYKWDLFAPGASSPIPSFFLIIKYCRPYSYLHYKTSYKLYIYGIGLGLVA